MPLIASAANQSSFFPFTEKTPKQLAKDLIAIATASPACVWQHPFGRSLMRESYSLSETNLLLLPSARMLVYSYAFSILTVRFLVAASGNNSIYGLSAASQLSNYFPAPYLLFNQKRRPKRSEGPRMFLAGIQ
jgi:hypothetical protein